LVIVYREGLRGISSPQSEFVEKNTKKKNKKNTKMCFFFSLHTYIIIYDMSCQFLLPFDVPSRLCILRFTSSSRVIVI
jgi:hypothetical protein